MAVACPQPQSLDYHVHKVSQKKTAMLQSQFLSISKDDINFYWFAILFVSFCMADDLVVHKILGWTCALMVLVSSFYHHQFVGNLK